MISQYAVNFRRRGETGVHDFSAKGRRGNRVRSSLKYEEEVIRSSLTPRFSAFLYIHIPPAKGPFWVGGRAVGPCTVPLWCAQNKAPDALVFPPLFFGMRRPREDKTRGGERRKCLDTTPLPRQIYVGVTSSSSSSSSSSFLVRRRCYEIAAPSHISDKGKK